MKPKILFFLLGSAIVFGQGKNESGKVIMLPNERLMRCESARLWQNDGVAGTVYPLQVSLDHFDKKGCPHGLVALYEKTIPWSDLKEALDRRYGKWSKADNGKTKLYRVESEGFAIQVTTIGESLKETGTVDEKGMKQVIYLSFDLSQAADLNSK